MIIEKPSASGDRASISRVGMSRSGGSLMRQGTLRSFRVPSSSVLIRANCRPRSPTSPTPALSV